MHINLLFLIIVFVDFDYCNVLNPSSFYSSTTFSFLFLLLLLFVLFALLCAIVYMVLELRSILFFVLNFLVFIAVQGGPLSVISSSPLSDNRQASPPISLPSSRTDQPPHGEI